MGNLININTLRVGHPGFKPAHHQAVKEVAHSSRELGPKFIPAIQVVHPLFCQLNMVKPTDFDSYYPPLNAWVKEHKAELINMYSAYCERLETALRERADFPIFLYAPRGLVNSMEDWITSLNPKVPVVMIETLKDNPIPCFEGIDPENDTPLAWKTLGDILRNLGITVTSLIGEYYYEIEETSASKRFIAAGCVGYFRHILLSQGFTCDATPDFVYPGFVFPVENLEEYLRCLEKSPKPEGHKLVWLPEMG